MIPIGLHPHQDFCTATLPHQPFSGGYDQFRDPTQIKKITTGSPTLGADPPQSFFSLGRQTPASQRPDQQPPLVIPSGRSSSERPPWLCSSRGATKSLATVPTAHFHHNPSHSSHHWRPMPLGCIALGFPPAHLNSRLKLVSVFGACRPPPRGSIGRPCLVIWLHPRFSSLAACLPLRFLKRCVCVHAQPSKARAWQCFWLRMVFWSASLYPPIVVIVLLYHSCCFLLLLAPCKRPPQFGDWGLCSYGRHEDMGFDLGIRDRGTRGYTIGAFCIEHTKQTDR